MSKTLLASTIHNLEGEISQLQTVMNTKQAQINQIQSLFLQASSALNTLQEAHKTIPQSLPSVS